MMPNYREINYDTTELTEEAGLMAALGLDLDTEMRNAIDTLLDDNQGVAMTRLIKSASKNKNNRHDFLRMNAEIMDGNRIHVKIRQLEIDENGKL